MVAVPPINTVRKRSVTQLLLWLLGCLALTGCHRPVVIKSAKTRPVLPSKAFQRVQEAWQSVCQPGATNLSALMQVYNEGVLDLLRSWPRGKGGQFLARQFVEGSHSFTVDVEWAVPDFSPNYFDQFFLAESLQYRGLPQYKPIGWGQPLIALATNHGILPEETYFPPEGIVRSLTAIVEFSGTTAAPGSPRLLICQPDRQPEIAIGGRLMPLATDFSSAYALLLSRTQLKGYGLRSFLNHKSFGREAGIFLMEPFRPDKIPVLMVHGLASSPLAWAELTDALWSNPVLRGHYQVWHYFYPTTFPYLHSAAELHDNLQEIREYFDPRHESAALTNMVIVAHSMGGLLARRLITDSGESVWTNAFVQPIEKMNCTEQERATLRRYFYFHATPGIGRVIFMATPHRGSDLAAGWEGRIGRALADQNPEFAEFFRSIALRNPDAMTVRMRTWSAKRRLSSVQVLSSENPVLRALSDLPIAPHVKANSILGDRGQKLGKESCDGVVTYRSAHLDQAESERIVPSGHAVNRHPEAIAETLRILYQHWREYSERVAMARQ